MNQFDEYQRKVACFGHELGTRDNVAHAIIGMTSEVGELREAYHLCLEEGDYSTNMIEEQGDCWWFAAWYATSVGCSLGQAVELAKDRTPDLLLEDEGECLDQMEMASCAMLSEVKRHLFYKTNDYDYPVINEEFLLYLGHLIKLSSFAENIDEQGQVTLGMDIIDVLDANYRKLATRYPDKVFNTQNAIARDTQAEYQAIEETSGC